MEYLSLHIIAKELCSRQASSFSSPNFEYRLSPDIFTCSKAHHTPPKKIWRERKESRSSTDVQSIPKRQYS